MINKPEKLLETFWKPSGNLLETYRKPAAAGLLTNYPSLTDHTLYLITIFFLFIAYNNLIPMVNPQQGRANENYEKLKKDYYAELAREAPPYLALIEMYNKDLTDMSKGKETKKGKCTGSLISTQHVLTYV